MCIVFMWMTSERVDLHHGGDGCTQQVDMTEGKPKGCHEVFTGRSQDPMLVRPAGRRGNELHPRRLGSNAAPKGSTSG